MPTPLTLSSTHFLSAAKSLEKTLGEDAELRLNVYNDQIATAGWERTLVSVFDTFRFSATIKAEKTAILQAFHKALEEAAKAGQTAHNLPIPAQRPLQTRFVTCRAVTEGLGRRLVTPQAADIARAVRPLHDPTNTGPEADATRLPEQPKPRHGASAAPITPAAANDPARALTTPVPPDVPQPQDKSAAGTDVGGAGAPITAPLPSPEPTIEHRSVDTQERTSEPGGSGSAPAIDETQESILPNTPVDDDALVWRGAMYFRALAALLLRGTLSLQEGLGTLQALAECFQAVDAEGKMDRNTYIQSCFKRFAEEATPTERELLSDWLYNPDTTAMLEKFYSTYADSDAPNMRELADVLGAMLDVTAPLTTDEATVQHGANHFHSIANRLLHGLQSNDEALAAVMVLAKGLAEGFRIAGIHDDEARETFVSDCFDRFAEKAEPDAFSALRDWMRDHEIQTSLNTIIDKLLDANMPNLADALKIVRHLFASPAMEDETDLGDEADGSPSDDASVLTEARIRAAAYGGPAWGAATLANIAALAYAELTQQLAEMSAYDHDALTQKMLNEIPNDLEAQEGKSDALGAAIERALRDNSEANYLVPEDILHIGTETAKRWITADINRRRYEQFLQSHPLDEALHDAPDTPAPLFPDRAMLGALLANEQKHVEANEELMTESALMAMREGVIQATRTFLNSLPKTQTPS